MGKEEEDGEGERKKEGPEIRIWVLVTTRERRLGIAGRRRQEAGVLGGRREEAGVAGKSVAGGEGGRKWMEAEYSRMRPS